MNGARKEKAYNLIEGIIGRTRLLDDGITGVKRIEPNQARTLVNETKRLTEQLKELIETA